MAERNCPACQGRRLKPEALAVTVADKPIDEVTGMSVTELLSLDRRAAAPPAERRAWIRGRARFPTANRPSPARYSKNCMTGCPSWPMWGWTI